MQRISLRTGFFAFTLLAITSLTGGILTSCSSASQSQTQNTSTTDAGGKPVQGHSNAMNHSMAMDLGPADAEFDKRFIDAMIPHHEGALTMAKDALSKSKRSEIKQLAQNILTSQQKEIDQMEEWRQAWYKN